MTQRQQQVAQNVTSRYLKKASLQQLLEKMFPGHTDFEIEMRDDVWHFKAPKEVDTPYPVHQRRPATSMAPTQQQCFVEDVIEPIRICSVTRLPAEGGDDGEKERVAKVKLQQHAITTFEELSNRLEDIQHHSGEPVHHFILANVEQKLNLPAQLMEASTNHGPHVRAHHAETELKQFVTGHRLVLLYAEHERGRGLLYAVHRAAKGIREASYTIRYPEYKSGEDTWVIRQTGVYHRCDAASRQSLFIMINPMPNSQASSRAMEWLSSRNIAAGSETETGDAVWLHKLVFETYLPAWRFYIASMERQFLPLPREQVPNNLVDLRIVRGDPHGAICPLHPPLAAKGVDDERRQRSTTRISIRIRKLSPSVQSLLADGDGSAPPRANNVTAAGQHALIPGTARFQEAE
ncbi:hypothetical protein CSIM01_05793 [Colletotrichum simmondsii]|uniref:CorA-like transporter domain-containing protein n=2 Tax=Colletotrichum acutatum species complex TaxID=2707335 RepID=A0A135S947_9PEZI|nr:hypothetical protein CSIM01_05793 [Colletotrichum simmondsii]